jgi:hypothetical protein
LKRKWKQYRTRPLVFGDGGDEGEQAGAAEELGDEDGGVALGFGGVDPLEARAQHAGLAAALAQHPATVAAHITTLKPTPRNKQLTDRPRSSAWLQKRTAAPRPGTEVYRPGRGERNHHNQG